MKIISQLKFLLPLMVLFITTNIPCIFANDTISDRKLSTKLWNGLCRDIIIDNVLPKLLAHAFFLNALELITFACKSDFIIIAHVVVAISFLAILSSVSFANFVISYIFPKKDEQSNIVNGTILIETKKTRYDERIERT